MRKRSLCKIISLSKPKKYGGANQTSHSTSLYNMDMNKKPNTG